MDNAAARKQRLREKRRAEGMKAYEVWLDAEGRALLSELRQDGESIDTVIRRALVALKHRTSSVTSHVPSHTDGIPSHVSSHGMRPHPPDRDDALLALLRQENPRLLYPEIAKRLGCSLSLVKHKATAWTKQGLLTPRPRGGARPRRGTP